MGSFEIPTNIKQMGSIGKGMKIYFEDYVSTYLHQLSDSSGFDERVALLLGRHIRIDGSAVLFINGAIPGKNLKKENDIYVLDDEFWAYAKGQIEKYFSGLEIVGLMYSQPGYGIHINNGYANYFMNNFNSKWQALYVVDPTEKEGAFYLWNDTQDALVQTTGYFIYFDKNESMHNFTLDNIVTKLRIQPIAGKEEFYFEEPTPNKNPELTIKRHLMEREKKGFREQKKVLNMLVSLSAVLFLICFIMGAGLIQNEDRITTLERDLATLNGMYKNLLFASKQDSTQSVFAAQTETPSAVLITENGNELLEEESQVMVAPQITESANPRPAQSADPTPSPSPLPAAPEETPESTQSIQPSQKQVMSIPETYTIQKGDNLSYISRKFYGTPDMADRIMEFNGIDNPNKIFFGKVIKLPRE